MFCSFCFLDALGTHFMECAFQMPLLEAFLYILVNCQLNGGETEHSSVLQPYNKFAKTKSPVAIIMENCDAGAYYEYLCTSQINKTTNKSLNS